MIILLLEGGGKGEGEGEGEGPMVDREELREGMG